MLVWKLYLSDLDQWRIQITGSHVPIGSKVTWTIPVGDSERLDEDTRDLILSFSGKQSFENEIRQAIAQKQSFMSARHVPSSGKIKRFIVSRQRRRKRKTEKVCKKLNTDQQPSTQVENFVAGQVVQNDLQKQKMNQTNNVNEVENCVKYPSENSACTTCEHDGTVMAGGDNEMYTAVSVDVVPGSTVNEVYSNVCSEMTHQAVRENVLDQFAPLKIVENDEIMASNEVVENDVSNRLGLIHSYSTVAASGQDPEVLPGQSSGVISGPMSQIGSLNSNVITGTQPMTLISNVHFPRVGGVPFISIDPEGQACYPNLCDIIYMCPQDSNTQQ